MHRGRCNKQTIYIAPKSITVWHTNAPESVWARDLHVTRATFLSHFSFIQLFSVALRAVIGETDRQICRSTAINKGPSRSGCITMKWTGTQLLWTTVVGRQTTHCNHELISGIPLNKQYVTLQRSLSTMNRYWCWQPNCQYNHNSYSNRDHTQQNLIKNNANCWHTMNCPCVCEFLHRCPLASSSLTTSCQRSSFWTQYDMILTRPGNTVRWKLVLKSIGIGHFFHQDSYGGQRKHGVSGLSLWLWKATA